MIAHGQPSSNKGTGLGTSTPRLSFLQVEFELVRERSWLATRVSYAEVGMNTEFFFDGPNGLLYYAGPAWTLLAIVVFLALLIAQMNRR